MDVAGISTFRNNALVGSGITLSPDGDGYYTGVITATKYEGDGSALTGLGTANVRTGILDVAGIATFRDTVLVGSAITISESGISQPSGVSTFYSMKVGAGNLSFTGAVSIYGSSRIVLSGGTGGDTDYYSGGTAYSDHTFYTLQGGLTQEKFRISANGVAHVNSISVPGISTLGIASFSSSGIVTTTDSVGVVTYYGDVSNAAHQRWYLGANGTDDYTFVGNGCTITRHDPTLFLARGGVYEFVNNMGAHPFRIPVSYTHLTLPPIYSV